MMHSGPDTTPFVLTMLLLLSSSKLNIPQWYSAQIKVEPTWIHCFCCCGKNICNAPQLNLLKHDCVVCPVIQTQHHHHHVIMSHCNLEQRTNYLCENSAAAFSSAQHWEEEECGWQWQERETCKEKFGCSHDISGQGSAVVEGKWFEHLHKWTLQTYPRQNKTFGCHADIL